jgi:8-oxo-dGTP diphosphatase
MDGRLYIVNVEAVVWRGGPFGPPSGPPGEEARDGQYLMIVRGRTEGLAPGALTPPGGKVEVDGFVQDVLEETLRREVLEETGVEVKPPFVYVESHSFEAGGETLVDIIMLARYAGGDELKAIDPEEIAGIEWLSYEALMADGRTMPWTRETMRRAEALRRELGW